jgi:(E)-4-hydroxy-3-methylbut-2-enyl-diphosphate synthase
MNTEGSVQQSIRMIDAGCELVRLTAPSKKEAENLAVIRQKLKDAGYDVPLVADIHFTPNAAEIAARLVQKVRVNPGNYADKKKFEEIDYTDSAYQAELKRIETKFTPLVLVCKEHGTAMRIGTNHGSLSDRILSKYGDTPHGMVESAFEFIRICEKNDFYNLVISMKASNTLVMVQAYRLLAQRMISNQQCYPIHLGVTEAGDGEDGRIKSAVGIGALLEDGLGDTIRVSLTEEPEFEIPVALKLARKYNNSSSDLPINYTSELIHNPIEYQRYTTSEINNIGGKHHPVVIGDLSQRKTIKPSTLFAFGYQYVVNLDKWNIRDQAADYVYVGSHLVDFEVPGTLGIICDFPLWEEHYQNKMGFYPLITSQDTLSTPHFKHIIAEDTDTNPCTENPNTILILKSNKDQKTQHIRKFLNDYAINGNKNPLILWNQQTCQDPEIFQLYSSAEVGIHLIDGYGDGIWLSANQPDQAINSTAFGILQATRTRISKTEYISCPSCGRTLFDLQETTSKIRLQTSHLKGIKIGIMGCIVNGPGEMADADYGYVGTGPGKITLYKEKEVVRKNVPESDAVQALIDLIKDGGDWVELPV